MIWTVIDTAGFHRGYDTLLLGLEGAVARAAGELQRSPAASIQTGQAFIFQAVNTQLPTLQREASGVLMRAAELGAADAAGQAPGRGPEDGYQLIESCVRRDALKASQVVRRQALLYATARMRMDHQRALLAATGQLATTTFAQLDRRMRVIGSANYATGLVRVTAAEVYAETFVATAVARGITQARLVRGDDSTPVDLEQLGELLEHFHPNTEYRLELPR